MVCELCGDRLDAPQDRVMEVTLEESNLVFFLDEGTRLHQKCGYYSIPSEHSRDASHEERVARAYAKERWRP